LIAAYFKRLAHRGRVHVRLLRRLHPRVSSPIDGRGKYYAALVGTAPCSTAKLRLAPPAPLTLSSRMVESTLRQFIESASLIARAIDLRDAIKEAQHKHARRILHR
jgi:hypothetical protein